MARRKIREIADRYMGSRKARQAVRAQLDDVDDRYAGMETPDLEELAAERAQKGGKFLGTDERGLPTMGRLTPEQEAEAAAVYAERLRGRPGFEEAARVTAAGRLPGMPDDLPETTGRALAQMGVDDTDDMGQVPAPATKKPTGAKKAPGPALNWTGYGGFSYSVDPDKPGQIRINGKLFTDEQLREVTRKRGKEVGISDILLEKTEIENKGIKVAPKAKAAPAATPSQPEESELVGEFPQSDASEEFPQSDASEFSRENPFAYGRSTLTAADRGRGSRDEQLSRPMTFTDEDIDQMIQFGDEPTRLERATSEGQLSRPMTFTDEDVDQMVQFGDEPARLERPTSEGQLSRPMTFTDEDIDQMVQFGDEPARDEDPRRLMRLFSLIQEAFPETPDREATKPFPSSPEMGPPVVSGITEEEQRVLAEQGFTSFENLPLSQQELLLRAIRSPEFRQARAAEQQRRADENLLELYPQLAEIVEASRERREAPVAQRSGPSPLLKLLNEVRPERG